MERTKHVAMSPHWLREALREIQRRGSQPSFKVGLMRRINLPLEDKISENSEGLFFFIFECRVISSNSEETPHFAWRQNTASLFWTTA
jgi:hypothetical protein